MYSYRPRWRSDASGAGQVVTDIANIYELARKAIDLALSWPTHDEQTLGDLVEALGGLPERDQEVVWNLIKSWSKGGADDKAKAALRERVRQFAFTRRGWRRGLQQATRNRAREAYTNLEPRDAVIRHAWLFTNQWVEESAEEIEDEDFDFSKRGERIHRLRRDALGQIWAEHGFEGIAALLSLSGAPPTVGQYSALSMPDVGASCGFVRSCLAMTGDLERKLDAGLQGFLQFVDADARTEILSSVAKDAGTDTMVRLFRCSPFGHETWRRNPGSVLARGRPLLEPARRQ